MAVWLAGCEVLTRHYPHRRWDSLQAKAHRGNEHVCKADVEREGPKNQQRKLCSTKIVHHVW